jgi:adenine phosphoribosyltransferase
MSTTCNPLSVNSPNRPLSHYEVPASLCQKLQNSIRNVPDFPKPGIIFKDIGPLLKNSELFKETILTMAQIAKNMGAEQIIGAESRGFLFGVPLALELNIPFIPARKKGKLPGAVVSQNYALEYGEDTIQIQRDALPLNSRNVIVDDIIATGGTCAAIGKLVQSQGAQVSGYLFLMELEFLKGSEILKQISSDAHIVSILKC